MLKGSETAALMIRLSGSHIKKEANIGCCPRIRGNTILLCSSRLHYLRKARQFREDESIAGGLSYINVASLLVIHRRFRWARENLQEQSRY